jgi:hypothetical protein
MPDDTSIDIVDGLKGQHVQLRRLLAQQSWIAGAPRNTLSEIDTQLTQIKSVIAELERVVAAQLVALKDQETIAQMSDRTELYRSPNGDTWYLARDPASDQGFVIHDPMFPPADSHLASKLQIFCDLTRTHRNIRHSYAS